MRNKWWLTIARTYISKFEAFAMVLTVVGVLILLMQLGQVLVFALVLAVWLIYLIAKAIIMFTPVAQRRASVSQVNPQLEPEKIRASNKMKNKLDKKSDCRLAWQSVVIVVAAVILTVFISVTLTGFQWGVLLSVFRNLWLILIIFIIVVSGLLFLVMRYPFWTATTIILVFAFIFMFASFNNAPLAQELRDYISKTFNTNFLLGSITFLALVFALATALKNRNK